MLVSPVAISLRRAVLSNQCGAMMATDPQRVAFAHGEFCGERTWLSRFGALSPGSADC
jgi:hypothetical protein